MILLFNTTPPIEALEGFDGLQALIQEHAENLAEWRAGKVKHDQLQEALQEARRLDEEASITAHRKKEKDPGNEHEAKVLKEIEKHEKYLKLREAVLPRIEKDISGEAQRCREKIPSIESAIEADNEELLGLLEKVRTVQQRRAARRGLVEWLVKLPGSYQAVTHVSNGISEDTALSVLVGSTQPPVEDPDQGSVRLVS